MRPYHHHHHLHHQRHLHYLQHQPPRARQRVSFSYYRHHHRDDGPLPAPPQYEPVLHCSPYPLRYAVSLDMVKCSGGRWGHSEQARRRMAKLHEQVFHLDVGQGMKMKSRRSLHCHQLLRQDFAYDTPCLEPWQGGPRWDTREPRSLHSSLVSLLMVSR